MIFGTIAIYTVLVALAAWAMWAVSGVIVRWMHDLPRRSGDYSHRRVNHQGTH